MSDLESYLRQLAAPHYLMELLIAHQVDQGIALKRLSTRECPPAGIRSLCVDGVAVVTEFLPAYRVLVNGPSDNGVCLANCVPGPGFQCIHCGADL